MSAAVRNLYIEQGADWAEDFQILDEDGVADDLTGCTIEGKARDGELRSSTVVFSFTFVVDTDENRIYVTVPKATTTAITTLGAKPTDKASTYYYDYELTRPGGLTERIQEGKVLMSREITRS
jgi:hypothetical protein